MKVNEIITNEMTMRSVDFDKRVPKYGEYNPAVWRTGDHIGDIQQFQLRKLDNYYSLWDREYLIAYIMLTTDAIPIVDDVWVSPRMQGQKIFSKLLWFFKTRLNHTKLMMGHLHSPKMQEVLGGLSSFKKFWTDGIQWIPFDPDTTDDFYSVEGPTKWRLVLENNGDFSMFPKFTTGKNMMMEAYDEFIQ